VTCQDTLHHNIAYFGNSTASDLFFTFGTTSVRFYDYLNLKLILNNLLTNHRAHYSIGQEPL
jgi:hypothetical protein